MARISIANMIALVALLGLPGCSEEPAPQAEVAANVPAKPEHATPVAEVPTSTADELATVADDGATLWVSPTAGQPLALNYLPLGTQLLLHVRAAELARHSEADRIAAALGPWGTQVVRQLNELSGLELDEIESLTVAVHSTMRGELHTTLRIELAKSISLPELTDHESHVCFAPASADGRLLVCCHADDLAELKGQGDEPALFPRDMQRLLDHTDRQRMVTLVFPTRFLKTEGHKLLDESAEALGEVVAEFAGDDALAVALSAHWGEQFFLELQSGVALNVRAHRYGAKLREWIPSATANLQAALAAEPVHPFGREVVERFPAMLQLLGRYARTGEANGVSVVRCYLPIAAGHNLLMASELLLSLPGEGELVAGAATVPKALREKLATVTSMSFAKDTLEQALTLLSEDIGAKIEIVGRDLQLEGITKNQSFGIDLRDLPAEKILQAVLAQANPDRTATGLSDVKQKLVYVLRGANSADGVIVVTTRVAAEKRGDALPEVFAHESD